MTPPPENNSGEQKVQYVVERIHLKNKLDIEKQFHMAEGGRWYQRALKAESQLADLRQKLGESESAFNEIYDMLPRMMGHNHWDDTLQSGAGCPICIKQREQRKRATELRAILQKEAQNLPDNLRK